MFKGDPSRWKRHRLKAESKGLSRSELKGSAEESEQGLRRKQQGRVAEAGLTATRRAETPQGVIQ